MTYRYLKADIQIETIERFHHACGWGWYFRFTNLPDGLEHLNNWCGPVNSSDAAHSRGLITLNSFREAWKNGHYR